MKKLAILTIALLFLAMPVIAVAQGSGALSPADWIRLQAYGSGSTAPQADSITTKGLGADSTSVYWFNSQNLIPYGSVWFRFVSRDSTATTKDSVFVPWVYYKLAYKDFNGTTYYATTDSSKSSLNTWTTIKAAAADSIKLAGRSTVWVWEYDFRQANPDGIVFKAAGCLARDTGSTIIRVKAAQPQLKNPLVF